MQTDSSKAIERATSAEREEMERQAARQPRQTPAPLDAREREIVSSFREALFGK